VNTSHPVGIERSLYVRKAIEGHTGRPDHWRRVLIVEDESDIAHLLTVHLRDISASAICCRDGSSGLQRALEEAWDLIVLDLSLPHLDGLEICARLRFEGRQTPILILTARSGEAERVLGLDVGADDYLTKPFAIAEFSARARALMRRSPSSLPQTAPQRVGDLDIDPLRREVRRAGQAINLTSREFDLLHFLVRHSGQVFSRAQLLNGVWGLSAEAYEHTVSSHINRLRGKLELNPAQPRYLLTVWGVGYRFAEE
jgi:two-component system, OmpR family, response regulator